MIDPDRVYLTVGPPGTGKTTYLAERVREAAERFGPNLLVTSLTRAAAAVVAGRCLPVDRERVGTLHAHAYRALDRPELAEVEGRPAEFSRLNPAWRLSDPDADLDDPSCDPYGASRGVSTAGDQAARDYSRLRAALVDRRAWPAQVRGFAAAWERWKGAAGLFDFQDLIDEAHRLTDSAPGDPALIYGDEAQDWSASELRLALKWAAAPGCRGLVMVGDPDQCLYGFRGSDPAVFNSVSSSHRRVLEQSWRVPRAVHRMATAWIARCESGRVEAPYRPRPEDGAVERLGAGLGDPLAVVKDVERRLGEDESTTVMLLASCGYMLDSLLGELRRRGVPFHNPYRRTRGDWNPLRAAARLLAYLRPDPATRGAEAGPWTWAELWGWLERVEAAPNLVRGFKSEVEKLARDPESRDRPVGLNVEDSLDAVGALFKPGVEFWRPGGCPELLDELWAPRWRPGLRYPLRVAAERGRAALKAEPRVVVGTVHSCKGGEADWVYLFPDVSVAADFEWRSGPRGRDAVRRVFYVGMTRARQGLVVCARSGGRAVDLAADVAGQREGP